MTDKACPDCERYKESARNWRHEAYKLSGRPLPWEGGDTWQGLTEEEKSSMVEWAHPDIIDAIELRLRERNT